MDHCIRPLVEAAEEDRESRAAREAVCRLLGPAFRAGGRLLWVGGYLIGGDRVDRSSPFGFGSDATVGLATVAQAAGELCAGAVLLLDNDHLYGAAALLRQVVELEYLAWAFAEDEDSAAEWLRSSKEARRRMWQPRHLRDRSGGRFRATEYGTHCDLGGHPTPDAGRLLPDHNRDAASGWWFDLAVHGVSAWEYFEVGAERLRYGEPVRSAVETQSLVHGVRHWRELDKLHEVLVKAQADGE